jgi:valyl-tRNA synthetase
VELVKQRAYGLDTMPVELTASARAALRRALSVMQRLFAPLIPFVSEEVWRWWNDSSVHIAHWPTSDDCIAGCTPTGNHELQLNSVCEVLGTIRRAKTEAKVSQRAEVASIVITAPSEALTAITTTFGDLTYAGSVLQSELRSADGEIITTVTLA